VQHLQKQVSSTAKLCQVRIGLRYSRQLSDRTSQQLLPAGTTQNQKPGAYAVAAVAIVQPLNPSRDAENNNREHGGCKKHKAHESSTAAPLSQPGSVASTQHSKYTWDQWTARPGAMAAIQEFAQSLSER
jgi:hypothetical protein